MQIDAVSYMAFRGSVGSLDQHNAIIVINFWLTYGPLYVQDRNKVWGKLKT